MVWHDSVASVLNDSALKMYVHHKKCFFITKTLSTAFQYKESVSTWWSSKIIESGPKPLTIFNTVDIVVVDWRIALDSVAQTKHESSAGINPKA